MEHCKIEWRQTEGDELRFKQAVWLRIFSWGKDEGKVNYNAHLWDLRLEIIASRTSARGPQLVQNFYALSVSTMSPSFAVLRIQHTQVFSNYTRKSSICSSKLRRSDLTSLWKSITTRHNKERACALWKPYQDVVNDNCRRDRLCPCFRAIQAYSKHLNSLAQYYRQVRAAQSEDCSEILTLTVRTSSSASRKPLWNVLMDILCEAKRYSLGKVADSSFI